MASIVPQKLLTLFTWHELETAVCGRPEVDVELLREMSAYHGCRSDDVHVKYLWEILRSFSHEQRASFLRFVWGRSRLPLTHAEWPCKFVVQAFHNTPADSFLPVSHTCFFTLDLPAYSSVELMRSKLLYAMDNCQAIDTDATEAGHRAAAMGWEG